MTPPPTTFITLILAFASLTVAAQAQPQAPENHDMLIYLGTSTGGKSDSRGIYLTRLDPKTGKLSTPTLVAEAKGPSFLATHPRRPILYACSEVSNFEGKKSGGIRTFTFDPKSGALTPQGSQPSGGVGPCFVEMDSQGKFLVTANYGSGSVALLPIDPKTGELSAPTSVIQHKGSGPNEKRQAGPHAHAIRVHPSKKFAFAADLGTDQLLIYRLDAGDKPALTPSDPPHAALAPGAGPRHIAFAPGHVYVVNELANTITAFAFDEATGSAREIQTISTLPAEFKETSYTAEITIHPNGKFLYASNRGHNSIAAFAIDPATAQLTAKGQTPTQGDFPRNFAIDPTGQFLLAANQNSGTLVLFRIDQETGALTPTGETAQVPSPTCVRFIP